MQSDSALGRQFRPKLISNVLYINTLSIEEIGFGVQERRVPLQAPVREDVVVAIFSGKKKSGWQSFLS